VLEETKVWLDLKDVIDLAVAGPPLILSDFYQSLVRLTNAHRRMIKLHGAREYCLFRP
jgi:hypothetical protein